VSNLEVRICITADRRGMAALFEKPDLEVRQRYACMEQRYRRGTTSVI
jgi:hypothetical protein